MFLTLEVYEYASIHFFKEKKNLPMYIISKILGQHKKSQFFPTIGHVTYYEWRRQTNHTLPHMIIIAKAVTFYVVQEILTKFPILANMELYGYVATPMIFFFFFSIG